MKHDFLANNILDVLAASGEILFELLLFYGEAGSESMKHYAAATGVAFGNKEIQSSLQFFLEFTAIRMVIQPTWKICGVCLALSSCCHSQFLTHFTSGK